MSFQKIFYQPSSVCTRDKQNLGWGLEVWEMISRKARERDLVERQPMARMSQRGPEFMLRESLPREQVAPVLM